MARRRARSSVGFRLSDSEQQLLAEVEDLKRLHALSLRLAANQTLADVLMDVLRTAAGLVGARLGSVQLLTPDGDLGMIGEVGFGDGIVDKFSTVRLEDCSTCAEALRLRTRIIVRDLRADPKYSEIAAALRSYGAVATVSTPILDSGGNVLAMFSVYWFHEHEPNDRELRALDLCADLAGRHVERSVAAKALRDRERRLAATYENGPVGIAELDLNGRYITGNRHFRDLVGYEAHELTGLPAADVTHPGDRAAHEDAFRRLVAGDVAATETETRYVRKDGSVVWVNVRRTLLVPETERAGYVIEVNVDITARKAAEEALRESEERFRTFVTTAQEGVWALDGDGRTTFINNRMANMLGLTPAACIGRPIHAFCCGIDLAVVEQHLAESRAGRNQEFELRLRRVDGSEVPVLAATTPLRDSDGAVCGTLGGFIDISERKSAEARQTLLMRELAHRGKNLVSVIQAIAARSLAGERTLDDARKVFIGRLQALANTYDTLTEEAPGSAPLYDIVSAGLASLSDRAEIRGPAIMVPARTAQTLSLVFHELATNAAKYGSLSVPSGRIAVTWELIGQGSGDERFLLKWTETGGPRVAPPARKGFGSVLVTSVVGGELSCVPSMDYAEDGFRYCLECSLSALTEAPDMPAPALSTPAN